MSIPADDDGKHNKTEMSKPGELIYRNFFDELRFAKKQQWSITNLRHWLEAIISALPC